MGWSISPDTGLVSIDQNGLLTYQEHTATTIYKISYSDDEGCSATKTVTLNKCTSCVCSDLTVTGKTDISKDGGSNITIGTLSKDSCMSNPRASSSTSWLSNVTVSGNDIKATVDANSESSSRNGSVTVTVDKEDGGTCDKTMNITQETGGGGGTWRKTFNFTMAINAHFIATFVVRIKITGPGGTSYYSEELGERYKTCDEKIESYSTSFDVETTIPEDVHMSDCTLNIAVENCHGFDTVTCVDDTSSYNYMINGVETGTVGSVSYQLSDTIPNTFGFIAHH